MSKSTRRLGRGLGSLISNLQVPDEKQVTQTLAAGADLTPPGAYRDPRASPPPHSRVATISVEELEPNPFQPRRDASASEVKSLAASIESSGLIQPIVVRPWGNTYQIITGERRWWAAKLLERKTVPVVVREASDEQMLELALVENIQREDLNAIDRAEAYRRYCTRFGTSPEQIAKKTGEDRSTVLNYQRLLDLPGAIREEVAAGHLSMGHARCLLGVHDETRQAELAQAIVNHQLSVRAVEGIVRRERAQASKEPASGGSCSPAKKSPHLSDIESRFEQALKTKVYIKESRHKHRGRIVIEYYSLDDFDRIATAMGVEIQ